MTMSWGPVERPVERVHRPAGAKDGMPTQSSPAVHEGALHHDIHYDATDSRHNRESGLAPWVSVDTGSGEASELDFSKAGSFADGPGPWRQT